MKGTEQNDLSAFFASRDVVAKKKTSPVAAPVAPATEPVAAKVAVAAPASRGPALINLAQVSEREHMVECSAHSPTIIGEGRATRRANSCNKGGGYQSQ
jgi:hypothetical protein